MSFITRFFSTPSLPPLENCTIELEPVSKENGPTSQGWLRWVFSYPVTVSREIYNTFLFIRYGEFRTPLEKNMTLGQPVNTFTSLVLTMHVTADPAFMKALLKHSRNDPEEGIFADKQNAQVFLTLLKDLYPQETITADDVLLTCHKEYVLSYRNPILKFLGLQNIKNHQSELEEIVGETVLSWKKENEGRSINITQLSHIFTMSVISKLVVGHPGPSSKYCEIAHAIDYISNFIMKRLWKLPLSAQDKKDYEKALATLRDAIEVSLTSNAEKSLVKTLKEDKAMTDLQVKSTLLLMYFGGSETTSSLLNYLFWQLGQHPEYQDEIFKEMQAKADSDSLQTVEKLVAESLRLFTPAYIIGREPAKDLACTIKDKLGNVVYKILFPKNEGILCAPTFAARNPQHFENPDKFDPHRFATAPKNYPWLPFGDGRHSCPGQWLAKSEAVTLVTAIVKRFRIESFPKKEIGQKGYMTLKASETVYLNLTERK